MQKLCVIFLLLYCFTLNSCKLTENIIQTTSEVDFSVPQKVQITYNEHIYDTTISFENLKLVVKFTNEKDLLNGACVSMDKAHYKIVYNGMVFEGASSDLNQAFLPSVIYSLFESFEEVVLFDSFDKDRECYYIKKNINGSFITFERYKTESSDIYSIEIK